MPEEGDFLQRRCDYLSSRLEENARELTRLDLLNLALTQQRRKAREALNFVRVAQARAVAATTIDELYRGVAETVVAELGMEGAAVLSCNLATRALRVLASAGAPGDLLATSIPPAVGRGDLVTASFASSTSGNGPWRDFVADWSTLPYFVWCPLAQEQGGSVAILAGNRTEDLMVRQPLSADTVEILASLAGFVRLRLEDMASTQRALGQREQRIRYLAEILRTSPIAVIATDESGKIEYVSPAAESMFGYPAEELVGGKPGMLNAEPNADDIEREILDTVRAGGAWVGELQNRRADGRLIWVRASIYRLTDADGQVLSLVGFQQDITEHRGAEEELRRSEERYRDLFESASDLIQSVDADGRFLYVNRAWRQTLGYSQEEMQAVRLIDILRPDQVPHCLQVLERVKAGIPAQHVETVFVTRDGREVPVEGSANAHMEGGRLLATRGIFRDISERKRAEAQLMQVQKLESLGVLAGGIAHDFNNILTAILGNISLTRQYLEVRRPVEGILEQAESACRRARDLTGQLLTFSKGGAPVRKTICLASVIRTTASLATRGRAAVCECRVEAGLWPVSADEGQISQVISNLVINAVQSEPTDQKVRVAADNVELEEGGRKPLPAGRYVRIAVEDRGSGIPDHMQERIFDPYFTTKLAGSGLGLATAHSIVQQHDGFIEVESAVGAGTTLRVFLPASEGAAAEAAAPRPAPTQVSGRVLLMDDEETVRAPATAMLEHVGYRVTAAGDGDQAVAMYEAALAAGDRYDAVILDLTVAGGMGGRQCLEALRQLDSGVRAIVCSGYSNDPVMARYEEHGFAGVLAKPFVLADLVGAIHEAVCDRDRDGDRSGAGQSGDGR